MKLLYLLLMTLPLTAKAQPLPDYCPKPLKLAYYGDWYPYMYAVRDGYEGTDWSFLVKITDILGCQLNVVNMPEKRAHRDIAGAHSMVMFAATVTEERAKYADFSKPYRNEVTSLFYLEQKKPTDNPMTVTSIVASSKMIGLNGAGWYGKKFESIKTGQYRDKFVHVPGMKKRIELLHRNRAQAIIEDQVAGCHYFHQYAPDVSSRLRSIAIKKVAVSYMFSREAGYSTHFLTLFNKTMNEQLELGVYNAIVAKHISMGC